MGKVARTSQYGDDDRHRAVVEYIVTGNISKVAKRLKIPRTTIQGWVGSDWWPEAYEQHLEEVNAEILANNLQIATKAQSAMLDRIDKGDVVRVVEEKDSDGKVLLDGKGKPTTVEIRQPIKARDLAVISGISQDKARVQLGQPTRIQANAEGMSDLMDEFRRLAKANEAKIVSEQ